ncbi:UvrD-helicase domain-containing protein [Anaerotardibacter muris]|uniref:UvrD-helicase domain-containing protein n=1 Tax=Anaerotardibacter muris TaxID=2941505 RepID=UPI002041ADB7|nr:UvrD-helicase domain-containing protein [Anaerotardibacter muris]
MDLSSATPNQKQIITSLDTSLSVAAGAGSGKTFTLTRRIGNALVGEGVNTSFIDSIDEVLAITFSRSGAAEMKERIRLLLQDEGLGDQARAVENAWITTIHGMCSRILREHALELGIDPAFEVIEDAGVEELWQRALETVLERWREEGSNPRLRRLIKWFPPSRGPKSEGIDTILTKLWEQVRSMPNGFESILIPETKLDFSVLLRKLVALAREYQAFAQGWENPTSTDLNHLAKLEDALGLAQAYLSCADLSAGIFDRPEADIEDFLNVALSFPRTSKQYRNGKPDADFFLHYRETYGQIAYAIIQEFAVVMTRDLLELLKLVDYEYQHLKGSDKLDNTDLLLRCRDALEAHPSLTESYRDQFKLIMVDEFQDTDLLQVAIIDLLSRNHGVNVMTVGDAQQSIYRFRGADVEVFFRHRQNQLEEHPSHQVLSLPDNFRSHGDILKFVDAIFSKRSFFGDDFLSLQAKGKVNEETDLLFEDIPRVTVNVLESRNGKSLINDVRRRQAEAIAEHFTSLRDAGASPKDMVILLGSMENVAIYSRALADAGFESVITAGSLFAKMKEVQLVGAVLSALSDQTSSTALFQVLSSPLFNISDEVFFALGHANPDPEDSRSTSTFAQRFWALCDLLRDGGPGAIRTCIELFSLSEGSLDSILHVLSLLQTTRLGFASGFVHGALHALFVDSGWLYRLQLSGAEGLATAANIFKALSIVKDWENEGAPFYQIADDFQEFLAVSKQTPGSLATLDSEYVRIMTIHSSKGLEFDHVALAEIKSGLPKSTSIRLDTCGDNVIALLKPPIPKNVKDNYEVVGYLPNQSEELFDATRIEQMDPSCLSRFLDMRVGRGELDDAQRLLYVGLTRAVKSLYLCLGFRASDKFEYEGRGVFGLLYEVFKWDKTPDAKTYAFDFKGTKPAVIHHEVLSKKLGDQTSQENSNKSFAVVPVRDVLSREVVIDPVRFDVVSYSSIAPDHDDTIESAREEDLAVASAFEPRDEEPMFPEDDLALLHQESAVALGTAFHRLAQRVIESRHVPGEVPLLPESAFEAQVVANELSPEQIDRLHASLDRWLASDLCARFMAAPRIYAEVPFMFKLEAGGQPLFLEGEIDGLALGEKGDAKHAFFIDYKTGGSAEETDEALHLKHLLQAQCYALALMRQGFEEVEANFIRVEREDPADPDQPQVVTYEFQSADIPALESAILAAYDASKDR